MEKGEDHLTEDDIKFLRESNSGRHFINHLKHKLAQTRMEVDGVSQDGLKGLQGRIATFKELILLFGEHYD